ncbi:MAG: response regulator transcription factor [Clostridia bacterium]|nr:response regulator transcription factor [Clostridia bacterium]
MAAILIAEDDAAVRQVLRMHLELAGHAVLEAEDAAQARALLPKGPDLAVLDVMMPGEDGFSLAPAVMEAGVPVLFVTAKSAVPDRVRGLKLGAQDYILKPYEPAELLARVENILRRTQREQDTLVFGTLAIDCRARRVTLGGATVPLAAMEYDLLVMLARRRGVAMSREELLAGVWGYDYIGETRTVDVHIQRLRSKIGAAYIETVYKFGYMFCWPPREGDDA